MRVFICPVNDGEAVEIRDLLTSSGEQVINTKQSWGATWQGLEAGVVAEIEEIISRQPDTEIIGIELGGPARWGGQNIDHHRYTNDDRRNPKSSLEQIADLLGVELNRHQKLVAINDVGWIPAMVAFGASESEIKIVRAQDRLAQGVSPDQEAQAVLDIKNGKKRDRKIMLYCPNGATSAHTDRLYGQYNELLTIDDANGKWIYYGPRHHQFFQLTEGKVEGAHWLGGGEVSGYAGAEKPQNQKELLSFFWEEEN